jgi:ketosteroid isomerase-like protein
MRILSKIIGHSLLSALILPLAACGDDVSRDLQAVVQSEQRFAQTALERGIPASFQQFLADDSVIFVPAPTNGKLFYSKLPENGRKLIWHPIFATISRAGDLGLTTGPWEMKKSAADETPFAFGEFVSIWKKRPDNSWKVALDFGINHPSASVPSSTVDASPPSQRSRNEADLRSGLEKAEEEFAKISSVNKGKALFHAASQGIRIFREDALPITGKESAGKLLATDHLRMSCNESGRGISRSGDLAYRYGSYSAQADESVESGHYLRIWQTDNAGDWKIILDLQKKAPPARKQESEKN